VSVTVGGAQAPLFSVSGLSGYQQINFRFLRGLPRRVLDPHNRNPKWQHGSTMAAAQGPPGDFFTLPNSSYGAFQHATDYSAITPANPAKPSETVVGYLTGLGVTMPAVPTGQASPYSPLAIVPQTSGYRVSEYLLMSPGLPPTSIISLA